jgi:hypothetical protein
MGSNGPLRVVAGDIVHRETYLHPCMEIFSKPSNHSLLFSTFFVCSPWCKHGRYYREEINKVVMTAYRTK